MEKNNTIDIKDLPATPLPAALKNRILTAIAQTTADVEHEIAEEKAFISLLKQLSPSPMSCDQKAVILQSIISTNTTENLKGNESSKIAYGAWYSKKSNLALVASVIFAALLLPLLKPQLKEVLGLNNNIAAQGFTSRNIISKKPAGKLQWKDNHVVERSYDVLYQDAFVFRKDKNTSIIIQVPNMQRLTFQEEII